jgi:hypothetical protein
MVSKELLNPLTLHSYSNQSYSQRANAFVAQNQDSSGYDREPIVLMSQKARPTPVLHSVTIMRPVMRWSGFHQTRCMEGFLLADVQMMAAGMPRKMPARITQAAFQKRFARRFALDSKRRADARLLSYSAPRNAGMLIFVPARNPFEAWSKGTTAHRGDIAP